MSKPEYIEAFPLVVMFGEYEAARFPADINGQWNAKSYADGAAGVVVDTTPLKRGMYVKYGSDGVTVYKLSGVKGEAWWDLSDHYKRCERPTGTVYYVDHKLEEKVKL